MTVNTKLSIAFAVSITFVILKIIFPSGYTLSYRIFDALYWLSVSYIPAYFVYLFVVYIPRRRDQKTLSIFVANRTAMLIGDGQAILHELSKAANHSVDTTPSAEDFNKICSNINPNDRAPLLKRFYPREYANWVEFLHFHKSRSERTIELLLHYIPYLESEHIRLITEINGCTLFSVLDNLIGKKLSNKDMSFLSNNLYSYYSLTRELAAYSDKHMKGFAWSKPRK